jgi:hypothetical protein
VTARVERGAALLDEKRPGWWREIDLEALSIESRCGCVLGQIGHAVYNVNPKSAFNYADGLHVVGIEAHAACGYGFDQETDPEESTSFAEGEQAVREEFEALTAAWRDLITARRADDDLMTELSQAMEPVPGEFLAWDAGMKAWDVRQQQGGQP